MDMRQEAALIALRQSALEATGLPSLLDHAARLLATTLEVEYTTIWELLADESRLVLRTSFGWQQRPNACGVIELGTGSAAGYALLTAAPVIVVNWCQEARFSRPPLNDRPVLSGLYITLQGHCHPFGVLGVDSTQYRSFTDDHLQFVQAAASLLAVAIERIQAEDSLRTSEARFRRLAENAADIIYRYRLIPSRGFDYVSPAATRMTGYTPEEYYADPLLAFRLAHPDDRELLEGTILAPTTTPMPLRVRLMRKDATLIWTEQRIVPLLDDAGRRVGVEGIVRDITEQVAAYQTLEQRVEERTYELERRHLVAEGFRTILTILNSNRGLNEILDHIVVQACQLLSAPTGAIYRLNQQGTDLEIRASQGMSGDDALWKMPLDCKMVGDVVRRRQPIAITNTALTLRPPHVHDLAPPAAAWVTLLIKRYGALLAVPLVIKDEVYGALALYYPKPRSFCDEEIRLATAMSDQAALAIENARLIAAAQGKAVLEERQRLARDLHDSVTQSLYGITLYAEAAARLLVGGDIATVASHLCELQDTAQEALQEMRRLIFELRPPVLEEAGLVAALQTRLETVEERSHLQTTLIVDGQFKVPAPIEAALYRIAQEALNNVIKHARSRHVMITLQQAGSMATLEIADDGIGFDPAQAQCGLGLRGMAERVTQLSGRLLLQSAPGTGTQVRVEFCL